MPKVTKDDLTLQDCTKTELISIVERLSKSFGAPAETFLELELMRLDLLRMRDAVRRLDGHD